MARAKAKGERGSWFATVNGERLPCVHAFWIRGQTHCDPGYLEGQSPWPEFVQAIRDSGKVIVTKDQPLPAPDKKSGMKFNRQGYVAVFSVGDVTANETGLSFDLVSRICDLQG